MPVVQGPHRHDDSDVAVSERRSRVEQLVAAVSRGPADRVRSVDVDIPILGGRRITGTVDGVRGQHLVDVTYSRLGPKQQIGSWIRLLALTAAGTDDEGWAASTLGKGSRGSIARTTRGPLPREAARSHLATLVDLYALGLTAPLPLPVKSAHAWAEVVHRNPALGQAARTKALAEWTETRLNNGGVIPGEGQDPWWQRVHGPGAPFAVLLEPVAGPGTDLASLAPKLWDPAITNITGTA